MRSRSDTLPRPDLGVLAERAPALLAALGVPASGLDAADEVLGTLESRLAGATPSEVWLTLAVLTGSLPTEAETVAAIRLLRADGPTALLEGLLDAVALDSTVLVETERALVEDGREPTATDELGSGIVVHQVLEVWRHRADARILTWDREGCVLVDSGEVPDLREQDEPVQTGSARRPPAAVVPWQVPVIVLRAPTDALAASRLRALVEHGASRSGAVGFGEPAITCNDRTPGEAAGAAHALTVLRHVSRLAAVGATAAEEYHGWREMVRTLDLPGPDIFIVPLPDEVPDEMPDEPAAARRLPALDADPLPLLVSSGGLGPRGNQLLVLRAANTLWRSGLHFQLVLLGYRRSAPAPLARQVTRLCEAGYPVTVLDHTDLSTLRSVLRSALCLVDVPQHDPIGLHSQIARSLGVPVLSGPHGRPPVSVREGALTDPDDSTSLAEAIRPFLLAGADRHSPARPAARSWRAYADDLWQRLVVEARVGA